MPSRSRVAAVSSVKRFVEETAKESHTVAKLKLKHKIAFIFGSANVWLTAWILAAYPSYFYLWHTPKGIGMLVWRFFRFRRIHYQYYMLDFCYYANAVLFAYLWVFPHSPGLFRVAFAFANGPLLFAVAAFRNSLVYHSIDHITSLWLHISPAFTTWALRWFADPEQFTICETDDCTVSSFTGKAGYLQLFLPSLACYAAWVAIYIIVVMQWKWKTIQENHLHTLFDSKTIQGLVKAFPESQKKAAYFAIHAAYSFVVALLSIAYWHNFYVHTGIIFVFMVVSAYNGSSYYFEVFASKYLVQLEQRAAARIEKAAANTADAKVGKEA